MAVCPSLIKCTSGEVWSDSSLSRTCYRTRPCKSPLTLIWYTDYSTLYDGAQVQACGTKRNEGKGYWYGPWKGYDHARCVFRIPRTFSESTDETSSLPANGTLSSVTYLHHAGADFVCSSPWPWCSLRKRYPSINVHMDLHVVRPYRSKIVPIAVLVLLDLLAIRIAFLHAVVSVRNE